MPLTMSNSAKTGCCDPPLRRRRNGSTLTSLMLVSVVVFAGMAAVAIDLSLISYNHRQLQAGSDAAALAGCGALMDRRILYPHLQRQQGDDTSDRALEAAQRRVSEAQRQAVEFAAQNTVAGQQLTLVADPTNPPEGDVVVGWAPEPNSLESEFLPWQGGPFLNAVQVRANRTARRGQPLSLWAGKLLGLGSVDALGFAQATLDQRVLGVRPARDINVPMGPLVVEGQGSDASWYAQLGQPAIPGRTDRYSINIDTGEIGSGEDGIPEIIVTICPPPSRGDTRPEPTNSWLWPIPRTQTPAEDRLRQIVQGLTADDLSLWNGELLLGMEMPLLAEPPSSELELVRRAVLGIMGQPRIWPLVVARSATNGLVLNFAAGQVVDSYVRDTGCLVLVVQPCVMTTPTAVVGPDGPYNPWIGKLMLTR